MGKLKELRNYVDNELNKIEDAKKRTSAIAHLYGVSLAAAMIAKKRGLDPQTASMAAMLHDLHAYKTGSYDDHAHKGAGLAREILEELKLADGAQTEMICSAVYHHDDKLVTDSPMDEVLKDADVIHHCMNDLSKPVKEKEQARFEKLCAEFGMRTADCGMTLYDGRPENMDGRLPREIRTYDFLDSLGIKYQRTDHGPADNMEACNEIDAVLGVMICKNLFLCNRQKTKFYLLMMRGDKKFKTKELSNQINSARLSFAGPEDMLKYLDIEPGAVSIMGLMNDHGHAVQLLMDEEVLQGEYIGCHPCVCTSSLKMKTEDVVNVFLPAAGHAYVTVRLTGEE